MKPVITLDLSMVAVFVITAALFIVIRARWLPVSNFAPGHGPDSEFLPPMVQDWLINLVLEWLHGLRYSFGALELSTVALVYVSRSDNKIR